MLWAWLSLDEVCRPQGDLDSRAGDLTPPLHLELDIRRVVYSSGDDPSSDPPAPPGSRPMTLDVFRSELGDRSRAWVALHPDERRRRAAAK